MKGSFEKTLARLKRARGLRLNHTALPARLPVPPAHHYLSRLLDQASREQFENSNVQYVPGNPGERNKQ